MPNRFLLAFIASVLLFAFALASSHADVLFSTFGSGNTYASSGVLVTGSSSPSTAFSEANEFTAGFSGQLSSLSVAVNLGSSAPTSEGYFDLEIAPNNPANNLPLLASAVPVGTLQAASTPAVLTLANPTAYPFAAGSTHWLLLSPHTSTTDLTREAATNPAATSTAYMSLATDGQFAAGWQRDERLPDRGQRA